MADVEAELIALRLELEEIKRRELENLKSQLASISAERDHFRAEAERNAQIGRQIHNEMQLEINRLRNTIAGSRPLPTREKRNGRRN